MHQLKGKRVVDSHRMVNKYDGGTLSFWEKKIEKNNSKNAKTDNLN